MTELSTAPAVLVERRGNVMIVTLNRPEARNAINEAVWLGAGEAMAEAERDVEVRAVIVTGAGDQSFCAGADLKALSRGERIAPADPEKVAWGFAGIVAHPISKPLIAAVNGTALGGGTEIALACDLVVAADTASFGLPEVKRGILAGAGGAFRLVQQLPRKIAMEMLLTGDPIDAARALDLGLINAVAPRATLLDAALELAERVAVNAPLSVQASKRIALGMVDGKVASDETAWAQTRKESGALMRSEDAREGPRAFAEKRAPVWKGR
ncbi:crotonase/enoyl-CoA hydratase family protein [Sphingomonas immobilis]|uniref:Crotonase/enoyl-CoA hydratase family protein n=1 Tax=Sphingomonas immobilis TaxID=3063997 RepID=A0ABT8ZX15_9SPHN|nr:crotonase/enoyl-CoA hydratase family protein [Sphingomonas sp. CA1-15]MDO7841757.1 crotonase/enoyl-CoA hydratase family protein [Sphingomonas sp. CA1-15]